MAFHVELDSGLREARMFNLSAETVRDQVIAPWLAGRTIHFADQGWEPQDSTLTILEGPELEIYDLAHGQGWSNAHRTGRDVTKEALQVVRDSLATAAVTVVAAEDQDEAFVRAALERIGAVVLPWAEVRDALLRGVRDIGAVAIAVGDAEPPADWWFDAGLAIGSLGDAAMVVQTTGADLPARLGSRTAVRLQDGDESFATAVGWARAARA